MFVTRKNVESFSQVSGMNLNLHRFTVKGLILKTSVQFQYQHNKTYN